MSAAVPPVTRAPTVRTMLELAVSTILVRTEYVLIRTEDTSVSVMITTMEFTVRKKVV